jgi:putative membrane-bound dehydrogenase-like protein
MSCNCSAALAVAATCLLACAGWSAESSPASNAVPRDAKTPALHERNGRNGSDEVPRAAKAPATNAPAGYHPNPRSTRRQSGLTFPSADYAFRIKPGWRLELVAAEPVVSSPVAMAFDEHGRLFVVERPNNPSGTGTNVHSGRIRLLEDTEGEGEFHTSTVFADNLRLPSAIACYGGGVFVAAGPDLIFLKDSKTNGIADVRNVIFSGFGSTNPATASTLPNNFNWGLDNRIHAASGGGAGSVPAYGAPGAAAVPLNSADFSFDPRELTLHAEAGPTESGLSFDDWGRKFTCDFMQPLRTPRYEPRYLARNPFFPPPPLMLEVASPATAIFRLATVLAAPFVASNVSSIIMPPVVVPAAAKPPPQLAMRSPATNAPAPATAQATNITVATWLTNAQGCVVYRGTAFPSNYLGNVFIADPSAHIIHRVVLREADLAVTAERAKDEANTEFLASADAGFRPVQLVHGPDGALYVVDRRDADERGRIYRLVPADFKRPKPLPLGKAKTAELVAALSHPNGWARDTAARLLYERRDRQAVPLLSKTLAYSRAPLARVHALHTLDGLGALNQDHVLAGLRDADGRVRKHAVLLAEKLAQGSALPDAVWDQLFLMSADASVRVRYQLAFTVGELHRPDSAQVLGAILLRDPTNPWIQAAVFSSLAEGAGNLFVALGSNARVRNDPVGQEWLRRLAAMIGVKGLAAEVAQVFGFVDLLQSEPQQGFTLLYVLGDGLHRTRSSLALADPGERMQAFYTAAVTAVQNYSLLEPWRIGALQVLGVGPYTFANISDLLLLQVGSGQSEAIQSAALGALGRFDDPRIAPAVAQRCRALTPRLRSDALTALLARSDRLAAVMAGLESGLLRRADLTFAQVNYLRTQRDPAISERARRLFGPVPVQRPETVKLFRPSLSLKGTAARGREIFAARCSACHQWGGATPAIGPDLTTARIYGRQQVLTAILEPNAGARLDYLTYVAETADGESLVGLLRDQNPATITLQLLKNGAQIVLPRANLSYLQPQPWSLMPDGLEAGLTQQNMADLLDYLLYSAL